MMWRLKVPASLAAAWGDDGRPWLDAAPALADRMLESWSLRPDGAAVAGQAAVVLPVRLPDGVPAVLKLQPVDDETEGEPVALRAWDGRGAVRLLRHDADTGSMLLERLDASRTLASVPDDLAALRVLSEILAGLTAVPAPAGLRRLSDIAADMLDRVPRVVDRAADPGLMRRCAAAVAEVLPDSGDRLLHWDLHYENVLGGNGRAGWLAIDPKPLAGDPGFDLFPALCNRWDDVVSTGDVAGAVRRRFDLMTEVLALDRQRAARWTLARALQQMIWSAQGSPWGIAEDCEVAAALLA